MNNVFKRAGRTGWYGKVKEGPKQWRVEKLFRDKVASERRLKELQTEAERRAAGVITTATEQALRPIDEHVAEYLDSLKLRVSSADHHTIASSMLERLATACGWKFIRDITIESVERVLPTIAKTEAYRNCFIKRGKAFASWLEEQGRVQVHPLRKLRRVSEKNATRTRARRAATVEDTAALFALDLPDYRREAYALAAFNGLRRNEIARLTWERVHLSATIPFIELAQKNGSGGALDSIPLHPYAVRLLQARVGGMPGVRVVKAVPDVKTVKADWIDAGVDFKIEGKRLDFHAMRHTFQTRLDQTGCSRATKKRLMRHAAGDVTDGYAHAELAEMLAALEKLQAPDVVQVVAVVATGTDGVTMAPPVAPSPDPRVTATVRQSPPQSVSGMSISTRNYRENVRHSPPLSATALPECGSGDIVEKTGPDTQVD